jgi:GT2 family glycosyltransferase
LIGISCNRSKSQEFNRITVRCRARGEGSGAESPDAHLCYSHAFCCRAASLCTSLELTSGVEHLQMTGAVAEPQRLAAEARRRLGPPAELDEWPLVSVVVLNRDGAALLRRLLAGLVERTDYPRLELILVDNASADDSLEFIRTVPAPFPISILANHRNESFSDACNQGAEAASGELLLFLNNDTKPFEPGWLRELVACLRGSGAGAVASTLVCPDSEHEVGFCHGYGVQHRGLGFREESDGMLHPALRGWEEDPLDERLGEDAEPAALAAACLLVESEGFTRVGGFTHGYVYGAEDVDLSLKLREADRRLVSSGRSLVIHHPVSTRRRAPFAEERARKLANRYLLWERWGPVLRREYELDLLEGGGRWALGSSGRKGVKRRLREPTRAEVEAPSFCIKVADPRALAGVGELMAALENRGHRCLALEGDRGEDALGLNYDVAVHVHGAVRYVPKPGQFNVLWVVDSERVPALECARYDLVVDDVADLQANAASFAERLIAAAPEHAEAR